MMYDKNDNKMASQLFLFDESSEIRVKLQFYYKEREIRRAFVLDANIKYDDGHLILYAEYDCQKNSVDDVSLFIKEYKKNNYKIIDAFINGKKINLKLNGKIQFTHFYSDYSKKICSMYLNHFYYTYSGPFQSSCYRLSCVASQLLIPYLTGLTFRGSIAVGTQPTESSGKCFNMPFSMFRDERHVYIQTENSISDLLSALTFFFCNPLEYDMVYSRLQEENRVDVYTPEFMIMGGKRNEVLTYLFSNNECLDNLFNFLNITNSSIYSDNLPDIIKTYIINLARAENLDNISKLLLYHTIIEKMAGVDKVNDTYNIIHKYLIGKHINIDKINDGIANKCIKNEKGEIIDNFVQLRNFFIHHLGSVIASDFLRDSEMLFYMKMAITILLLKQMGIEDVKFDKQFHKLSIFDESIEECDAISALFKLYRA